MLKEEKKCGRESSLFPVEWNPPFSSSKQAETMGRGAEEEINLELFLP